MRPGRLGLAALVAVVMNAIGAFNVLRSQVLVFVGLPGMLLGFLVPQSLGTENFRLILIPLVWGGSFIIWLVIAYAVITIASRHRKAPVV